MVFLSDRKIKLAILYMTVEKELDRANKTPERSLILTTGSSTTRTLVGVSASTTAVIESRRTSPQPRQRTSGRSRSARLPS